MYTYDTVTDAVQGLAQRGFTYNFSLKADCMECPDLDLRLHPEQFDLVEFHRFEGPTDPADSAIVYAIVSEEGILGVLVRAFGPNNDDLAAELLQKLNTSD